MHARLLWRITFLIAIALAFIVSGCATQPAPDPYLSNLPGFWTGLLHGILMPFTFIGSLFTHVRIYNFPNSGRWYDFGFVIGAALIFEGGSQAR